MVETEAYIPQSDAESMAILEDELRRMVDDAPAGSGGSAVTDRATLEDMLGEAKEYRRRGTVFYAVPPVIEELSAVLKIMPQIEAASAAEDYERAIALQVTVARKLLWIKEGDTLRSATEREIRAKFPLPGLQAEILRLLALNGLEAREGNS